MKCTICHSTDITVRRVNEQLPRGEDMILAPVGVLVCNNCTESDKHLRDARGVLVMQWGELDLEAIRRGAGASGVLDRL